METWAVVLITALSSVGASSGFWAYLQSKGSRRDAMLTLLLGLAHDRIIFLGMGYLARGSITKDEYQDYMKYLCEPYAEFGGNGLADKVVEDVKKLPIRGTISPIEKVLKERHAEHKE